METGYDTVLPADSVEFCPYYPVFAVGTYKLEIPSSDALASPPDETAHVGPAKQKRRGKCMIFKEPTSHQEPMKSIHELELPAILDMKWCHNNNKDSPLLAIADSEGCVSLHQLDTQDLHLETMQTVQCRGSEVLCLSIDWSKRMDKSSEPRSLIISCSDGNLCLVQHQEGKYSTTQSWHAHDYEPWIAAWNYTDTNVFYSGGDDLKLKGWDIRQGFDSPIFTNNRFESGVTTIQSHPWIENLFGVGSYDGVVRLYDARNPLTALTQVDMEGGVWRIKWHPEQKRSGDLLAACMHAGFKICRFSSNVITPGFSNPCQDLDNGGHIIKTFDKHESLAYGVDWSYSGDDGSGDTTIASCSFYDHALHIWKG